MNVWIIVREDGVTLGQGHEGVQDVVPKIGADYNGAGGETFPAFSSEAAAEAYLDAHGMVFCRPLEFTVWA